MWVVADLDDDYIAKMEDVLEVYERPYDPQEPVVCLDEKPITLHADVRPASPAVPGREARQDNEYERCGTANVFCAVEPKAGRHFTFATPDRSGFEFAQVAVTLAMAYPDAKTIHLVMDNLNIHRRKALADVFGAEMAAEVWDRFTVHYTPTHGSWLNQAEIEIGMFSRQCLGKRRIPSLKISKGQEAKAWNRRMNRDRVKIAWKFDRKAARRKFGYKSQIFQAVKDLVVRGATILGIVLARSAGKRKRANIVGLRCMPKSVAVAPRPSLAGNLKRTSESVGAPGPRRQSDALRGARILRISCDISDRTIRRKLPSGLSLGIKAQNLTPELHSAVHRFVRTD